MSFIAGYYSRLVRIYRFINLRLCKQLRKIKQCIVMLFCRGI